MTSPGINIRSTTGETVGDGEKGKKASGLLMVNGVLYLWVRNAGNSQLAWSPDRGQTWSWSDWTFTTSFGAPTFLNFGRNYAGARDGFVYVYSHDVGQRLPAGRPDGAGARAADRRIRDRRAPTSSSRGSTGGADRSGRRRWKNAVRRLHVTRAVLPIWHHLQRRAAPVHLVADAARRRALRGRVRACTMRRSRGDRGPRCSSRSAGMSDPARPARSRRSG